MCRHHVPFHTGPTVDTITPGKSISVATFFFIIIITLQCDGILVLALGGEEDRGEAESSEQSILCGRSNPNQTFPSSALGYRAYNHEISKEKKKF
jgi:hypothetical protein